MAKIYVLAGVERCDFTYYLGKILSVGGHTVLLIDNSISHDLFLSVAKMDKGVKFVNQKNITYLKDAAYSESLYNMYDFVLVYQGMRIDKEEISVATHVYFFPDFLPITLQTLGETGFNIGRFENSSLIFRDQTASKISSLNAATIMDVPRERVDGAIPYDYKDYGMYVSLAHNGQQSIKELSPSFMEALMYVAGSILDVTGTKDLKGIMKKARKV